MVIIRPLNDRKSRLITHFADFIANSLILLRAQARYFFSRAHAFDPSTVILVISAAILAQPILLLAAAPDTKTLSDLTGADKRKKYLAIQKLGKNPHRASRQALRQSLSNEQDPHGKLVLLDSLMQTRDVSAVPTIERLLKDPVAGVRQRAAMALGVIGGQSAAIALEIALNDSAIEVRNTAIRSLALCGDTQSLASVRRYVSDSDPNVRANAKAAEKAIEQRKNSTQE